MHSAKCDRILAECNDVSRHVFGTFSLRESRISQHLATTRDLLKTWDYIQANMLCTIVF